nr:hypothetical protein [Tanacetum cinerariifolium]
ILLGLPEDVYDVVYSCETAKEIWECVRQMMKGSDIEEQEKKNGGIQGVQNVGVQNAGNQNRLVVVPGIANQSGTGNVVAAKAEGTGNGNQAKCYNCRGLGQYTDQLEPIPEPQLVLQNDNHVTYVAPSMVQSGGTVETSSAPNEET